MKKILLTPLAALSLYWSGAAIGADFVAVRIEAENFSSKSDRWVLTSPTSVPDTQPDPDPPHNSSASGGANLELLPDSRVTHEDEVFNGGYDGNFWGGPGGGPRIDYNVDVPEPGRYLLYVKTFSTGTEDNGLHAGINGTLPESGKRIQICSKHNWFWTSGQRTNDNHCGVTKTIWLDVPVAGTNTITFFAREDGFEIDQFLLLKETHDGSLDCFPTFNDKIRCRDVATGATLSDTTVPFSQTVGGNTITDPPPPEPEPEPQVTEIDLDLDINSIGSTHFVNDTIEYRVKVTNKNTQDTASNTIATISLPSGLQYAGSSECTENANIVSCDFNNMAAGSNSTLTFFAQAMSTGNHRVDAQVSADENDNVSSNNTDSATVSAAESIPDFEAGITLHQSSNVSSVGGQNSYTVMITNYGLQEITTASLQIDLAEGIALDASQGCNADCAVPAVLPGQSVEMDFHTIASASGEHAVTVLLILADDADSANNSATSTETVVESVIATGDNGEIVIEAESFSALSPAATDDAPHWLLINQSFTALDTELDPDQASPVSVSGSAYMELLPDTRIDANGARQEGLTNFSTGGVGTTMSYNVFFTEAGIYNVLARIRANNTEDATLHVGINNDWPATSESVSVCNPDGSWQWTRNLKTDSGCSTTSAATIEVDRPGMQVVMVSQDTDGLELDKLILSKNLILDLTGNGPAPKVFDPATSADIAVSTSFSKQSASTNEEVQLIVQLSNESSTQESVGLIITIDGLTQPQQPTFFDTCSTIASGTECSLERLDAGQTVTETFNVSSSDAITLAIQTSVTSALTDNNALNNSDEVTLTVTQKSSGGGSLSLWFLAMLLMTYGTALTRTRRPVSHRFDQP